MRKPFGYWNDINNVKKHLQTIIDELEHYPSRREIVNYSSSLHSAIKYKHGGFGKMRSLMGYEVKEYQNELLSDLDLKKEEDVTKALILIKEKYGKILTRKEMKILGFKKLVNSIEYRHGGFRKNKLKVEPKVRKIPKYHRMPSGYWRSWENVKQLFEKPVSEFYLEHKRLPTKKELYSMTNSKAAIYLSNYFGGVKDFYLRLGYSENDVYLVYKTIRKQKTLEDVKSEMKRFISNFLLDHKKLPRRDDFPSHIKTVIRKHGGVHNVYETLGYLANSKKKEPKGFWESWDNIEKRLRPLISSFKSKNDRLPNTHELKSMDSRLLDAIYRNHGTLDEAYLKLGYITSIKIKTEKEFIDYVKNNEIAKLIIEKFGNDKHATIDMVSVITDIPRSRVSKYIEAPSLEPYLGKYTKGINNIKDLVELEEKLLQFDKNGTIEAILKNASLNFMRKKLGVKPSNVDIKNFEKELQISLYEA